MGLSKQHFRVNGQKIKRRTVKVLFLALRRKPTSLFWSHDLSEKTEVNLKSTSGIEECLAFTTDLKSGFCNSSSTIVFSRRISKYYCS